MSQTTFVSTLRQNALFTTLGAWTVTGLFAAYLIWDNPQGTLANAFTIASLCACMLLMTVAVVVAIIGALQQCVDGVERDKTFVALCAIAALLSPLLGVVSYSIVSLFVST